MADAQPSEAAFSAVLRQEDTMPPYNNFIVCTLFTITSWKENERFSGKMFVYLIN